MDVSRFPMNWRAAYTVCMYQKKGDSQIFRNKISIGPLSVILKIIAKVVTNCLLEYAGVEI